jgi:threonine/homoserine/homoserine lactone efflux protein
MEIVKSPYLTSEERPTWKSLFWGTVVWFLHQNIVYGLASLSCVWGRLSARIGGVSMLQIIETILTVIALLLMLFLIYLPWRDWRRFQSQRPRDNPQMLEDTEKDRRPLVAFITLSVNGFYFLFIMAAFVPIWTLKPCVAGS